MLVLTAPGGAAAVRVGATVAMPVAGGDGAPPGRRTLGALALAAERAGIEADCGVRHARVRGIADEARARLGRQPGRLHEPPGHSLPLVHGVPTLPPPMQRRPPQIGPVGPGGSGQSTLAAQGSALALLHVSQRHLLPGAPKQPGLSAERVRVTTSVV